MIGISDYCVIGQVDREQSNFLVPISILSDYCRDCPDNAKRA